MYIITVSNKLYLGINADACGFFIGAYHDSSLIVFD